MVSGRITVLYDNRTARDGVRPGWGFSALIEAADRRILFDTGADKLVLEENARALAVDLTSIDILMLSHEHCDHIGAITSALHEGLEVFYPASSSVLFQKEAEKPERPPWHAHAVSASAEIAPGITSTGEMGKKVVEQALVVDGSEGPILVTGCAHPGIVEMARAATHIAGEPISLVIGGFHLYKSKNPEIRKIAGALRQLGVKRLAPCHCTGESAIKLLLEAFGPDGLDAMAGTRIAI